MPENMLRDFRYAVRLALRNPGFAAVVILTVALGIGANTAIFSVVNAVLLKPLPFTDPDRLVRVSGYNTKHGWSETPLAPGAYFAMKDQTASLSELAAYSIQTFTLTGGDEPLRISGARASVNLFRTLGVRAERGHLFTQENDRAGAPPVVLVGHGFWQRHLGGDPEIVGKTMILDETAHTVIGVMGQEFRFPSRDTAVWVPLRLDPAAPPWRLWFLRGIGRLAGDEVPSATLQTAQAEIDTVATRFAADLPFGDGWGFRLEPLSDTIVGNVRPALLILFCAVGLVLLIACTNVANLLLTHGSVRRRELAVRAALGASRTRVVRLMLTESLLLSSLGGMAGLVLANWLDEILIPLLPEDFPRLDQIGFDLRVLGFAVATSLATALLVGLFPALQSSRLHLMQDLKGGASAGPKGRGRSPLRESLVATELALSIILLVGTGLLGRSFIRLMQIDPGHRTEDVITMRLVLPESRYPAPHHQAAFTSRLIERVSAMPGIQAAGVATGLPIRGAIMIVERSVMIDRGEGGVVERPGPVTVDAVSPGYLRALGIPLRRGRRFSVEDDLPDASKVVLINETMARRCFSGREPVGSRILSWNDEEWFTVVGVVGDVKRDGLDRPTPSQMYVPFAQQPHEAFHLTVHAAGGPGAGIDDLKRLVWSLDPQLPIVQIQTLEDAVAALTAPRRFNVLLMTCFGILALILATIGVYGAVAYSAARRTQEMGVRIALGARSADILRLVVGQGMRSSLAGIAIGLAGAVALTRYLESMVFEISTTDTVAFAASAVLMAGVAFAASLLPALRAARIDPVVALRDQ